MTQKQAEKVLKDNGFVRRRKYSFYNEDLEMFAVIGTTGLCAITTWTIHTWKKGESGANYYTEDSFTESLQTAPGYTKVTMWENGKGYDIDFNGTRKLSCRLSY